MKYPLGRKALVYLSLCFAVASFGCTSTDSLYRSSSNPYNTWALSWGWHGSWEATNHYYSRAWEEDMAQQQKAWTQTYGAEGYQQRVEESWQIFENHRVREKERLEQFARQYLHMNGY